VTVREAAALFYLLFTMSNSPGGDWIRAFAPYGAFIFVIMAVPPFLFFFLLVCQPR